MWIGIWISSDGKIFFAGTGVEFGTNLCSRAAQIQCYYTLRFWLVVVTSLFWQLITTVDLLIISIYTV